MTGNGTSIRRLSAEETAAFRRLNRLFAACFDDPETYLSVEPSDAYLADLLTRPHIVPLVAVLEDNIVGGLVAYELDKFEQQRREIYIYDLAVDERFRRQCIATDLIGYLWQIARQRNASTIFVQADREDKEAIALYSKLGRGERVMQFDIDP